MVSLDGHSHKNFEGAEFLFFTPQPHGQCCDEKNKHDRKNFKKRSDIREVSRPEFRFNIEEPEQGHEKEHEQKDKSDGREKVRSKFFFTDRKDMIHDRSPELLVIASSLNTESRVRVS